MSSRKDEKAHKKPRKKKRGRDTRSAGGGAGTMASRADKDVLYEKSVQEPEADIDFVIDAFRAHFGRRPKRLAEDFCGTAAIATDWVRAHRDNHAWGIDIDPRPLESGRRRHAAGLKPKQRKRLRLIEGNVLTAEHPKVDVVLALNFSYFTFKTRDALRDYFRIARDRLRPKGMLVLDIYGGPEAQRRCEESTEHDGFDYIWDQDEFNPINHGMRCYIHFAFPDGSRIDRAFSYDWRLWTVPELREILEEAGFDATEAHWEGTDEETGEGDGIYLRRDTADPDEAWVSYVVGYRGGT